ncbi:glutamate 5-kinase [Thermodesulfatator indicus DSM 15286]|uniref:Glutamate 5-kinase n=1 Tax=Thermodesulfatator indicus (strain DSM 15286 / JCM 11887 / CIR29812) TaxID=667014 RepID=F8ADM1_THEID|nr:glutamate 5-kinase [Thermodesulfatator indicus]AEH44903.1 glutamate 5-kinase [Thermodesulfatator indicus DSM 15286]
MAANSSSLNKRRPYLERAKRIVVKVGSAVITGEDGLSREVINNLSAELSRFAREGYEVVLVSSGAIACGRKKLGLPKRQFTLTEKQALAATGQAGLIQSYEEYFEQYGQTVAQILLTRTDLEDRHRYLLARNTILKLLRWRVIPIINENDTVAVEEIQFGDNDLLAAMVTGLIGADILICLSDIDALFDKDPREDPTARPVRVVEKIDQTIEKMAGKKPGRLGRGGMVSKIRAAKMVTSLGIPMVIAPGREPMILEKIFAGKEIGTFFLPAKKITARKFWIAYHPRPEGALILDEGAVKALVERNKSLLPAGIKEVRGVFDKGACVECLDEKGRRVALGLTNFSSNEIQKIKGCHSREICQRLGLAHQDEVIHRDNLVLCE